MSASADQVKAAAAVLVQSDPMPYDAVKVTGTEFNKLGEAVKKRGHGITVEELLESMYTTGFQASALGKAVEIIEQMV